jgi:phosphotriesterase-related protein
LEESTGIERRRFLSLLGTGLASPALQFGTMVEGKTNGLISVAGNITAEMAGVILPHEHVMSLFGAELAESPEYDREALFAAVIPYLKKLKSLGCGTLADCTTAFFGRDPELLREISEKTGVHILTNTGYYAAADDRYIPPHAYQESAEQVAARWIEEFNQGIGETGIRPGFIKTGVDAGPLSEIDARMIRAAAITHRETGLTIATHTGNNPGSVDEQLKILKEEGVAPSAWIWVHAHSVENPEQLLPAAEAGAWIELDGVSAENAQQHFDQIAFLRQRGIADQVLLSHDGNSFRFGGRPTKPYEGLFTAFIPLLESRGFSKQEIGNLISRNPFQALVPRKRLT